jgi:hypothetical protein
VLTPNFVFSLRLPIFLLASYAESSDSLIHVVFYTASSVAFVAFATVKVLCCNEHEIIYGSRTQLLV